LIAARPSAVGYAIDIDRRGRWRSRQQAPRTPVRRKRRTRAAAASRARTAPSSTASAPRRWRTYRIIYRIGSGAPSYYLEQHVWLHLPVERLAMSLICEGVFDEYPRLQVALVEACLTWSGPLQWAMDAAYEVAGNDAPRLSKLPSEYFREHFWLSTQPIEEPENPRHLVQSIEFAQLTDRVMFSSDYPHWDFDSPAKALPAAMPAQLRSKVMGENAARLYARRLGRG
jgi:predicted TIM-barrel fold metal-dependent hydrolase